MLRSCNKLSGLSEVLNCFCDVPAVIRHNSRSRNKRCIDCSQHDLVKRLTCTGIHRFIFQPSGDSLFCGYGKSILAKTYVATDCLSAFNRFSQTSRQLVTDEGQEVHSNRHNLLIRMAIQEILCCLENVK